MDMPRESRAIRGIERLGRVASIALLGAATYGLLLIAAGFVVPVYESSSTSSSGYLTKGSETLIGENGTGAVVVLVDAASLSPC